MAVFGLGDQISYAENYADATGELYDVFNALGCHMVDSAAVSTDGYEHTQSKSILKGSDGTKFCGLLLDQINQEEDTDIRIAAWVLQLVQGGFLDGDSSVSSSTTGVTPVTNVSLVQSVRSVEVLKSDLERGSAVLTEYIAFSSVGGGTFTPHTNPVTGQVLWTSLDGRQSFMTPSTSALRP